MFLNCHSFHSLRYGTIPTEDLVELAKKHGVKTLALTDINTAAGVYDFYRECKKAAITPIVGIEFRQDNKLLYIGLAKTEKGFSELCKFSTKHKLSSTPLPDHAPAFQEAFVIYPLGNAPGELRGNEFIGLRPGQLAKTTRPEWKHRTNQMVVLAPVTIGHRTHHKLHKIFRAIDRNTLLEHVRDEDQCLEMERMASVERVLDHYRDFPEVIDNTLTILANCKAELEFHKPRNKECFTESKEGDLKLLESLAYEGLIKRYGHGHKQARARVKRELKVIGEMSFGAYFLITWDIVRYSKEQGLMHVGRGSGANSIVSYCLGITDICPLELNLYFERFLNPSRTSPPDFDIDWSWRHRDKILTYVFDKYGADHVAFTGTIVQFRYSSSVREVGKAYGLSPDELRYLKRNREERPGEDSRIREVRMYANMLRGFPNQRSMHACGVLISEKPITDYATVQILPKGFPTVEMDMNVAEDIGLDKFDILSQRGLGTIETCLEIIKRNYGIDIDISNVHVFKNDAACNEFLKIGRTIGCFYIESPAMRGLLRKLGCDCYKVLVAASSIIRPGVAQSGMATEYVWRHKNPGKFGYFHPVFEQELGDTHGVMVYQEDVMKVGHHFAGLSLAEADILRRSMNNKKVTPEETERLRAQFFANCKAAGHSEELTAEVFRQIKSFAGFSFCKAHSASYAVESYLSLWLKVNYPIEFMVAAINNFGGFYRTEVYVHEAKMAGANILNPCVNNSDYLTTVTGKDVHLGFVHMKGFSTELAHKIVAERTANGEYKTLEDFIYRTDVTLEDFTMLTYVGALAFTGKSKGQLILWGSLLLRKKQRKNKTLRLFNDQATEYSLPLLAGSKFDDAFDEIDILGFSTSFSPFELLQTKHRGDVKAKSLAEHADKNIRMLGYLISTKEVPTKQGMMMFGTWIDADGNMFDTAHFANNLRRYPFESGGCYLLRGEVQVDNDFPILIVEKMAKMPFIADSRYRDKELQAKILTKIRHDESVTHRAPYPTLEEIDLPRKQVAASQEMPDQPDKKKLGDFFLQHGNAA